jgi:hypothetical protein
MTGDGIRYFCNIQSTSATTSVAMIAPTVNAWVPFRFHQVS